MLFEQTRDGVDVTSEHGVDSRLECSFVSSRVVLAPVCSGDHTVDNNVDGEAKPLIAIASNHLRGVGGKKRKPVGR